ncbi:hypothetical protein RRF57_006048 [Xylaria bambusicola]|uniref:Uncharacterized protein n=1 Tax=Xylaria bambusicola TaxID=326684 RepID=A0AAN7UPQ7_9PEZI
MYRHPEALILVTAPAPRAPIRPPTAPPTNANPFASARNFKGRISEGIACTIEMVDSVVPINTPPPISTDIDLAVADTTAPTNAMSGGMAARYFRSSTSESRPTMGERTLWIRRGPWMIHPAIGASPRSRMMKAITDPAATTTKTWAITLDKCQQRS